ncbi:MAG: AraC family transcriptional regulator ligand-binding domain-containing protein [Sandaracinaceae bacterium]
MATTARTTTALVSVVLNTGIAPDALAARARVPAVWLREPTIVAYEDGIRLWDAAEALSGDACVGLHAGARFGVDQLGALGAAFMLAPTLRAAIKSLPKLIGLVVQGVPIAVDEDRSGATFRYRSPSNVRHGVDAMFAAVLAVARQATRRSSLSPILVHFQSSRPDAHVAEYTRYFGVEPTWYQRDSALRFRSEDIDRPMRGADARGAALLSDLLVERYGPGPRESDSLARMEAAIEAMLPRGEVTLAALATELKTSVRTLQRRLREEGTTFAARRDAVLHREAERLLARGDLSLEEVAERLGYSGRPAFARAYRRWTGRTPGDTRRGAIR